AASAQPIPAVWNDPPASRAAASMATTPAGAEITTTDEALARRDATPPRKSALPYSAAAASANATNTADLPVRSAASSAPHHITCSPTYRPLGRRVIIRGRQ